MTISNQIKSRVLDRDNFICQKCDFSGTSENLEIHTILIKDNEDLENIDNLVTLCSICRSEEHTSELQSH